MLFIFMSALLQAVPATTSPPVSEPPRLRNPLAIFTYQDYPQEALRREEFGVVSVTLQITADGRVSRCDVTETSGYVDLDAKTCSLLKLRGRFDPAKVDGVPSVGQYRFATSWGVEEHQPNVMLDVSLQISKLPLDYRSPVRAQLIFDDAGHIAACEVTVSSGSGAADQAACAYIKQRLNITPPRSGSSDVPAAAVRYLTATLSSQSSAAQPRV